MTRHRRFENVSRRQLMQSKMLRAWSGLPSWMPRGTHRIGVLVPQRVFGMQVERSGLAGLQNNVAPSFTRARISNRYLSANFDRPP
jgi:hypothetical protein